MAQDFAILNSGYESYLALYSVGFFGIQREAGGPYVFCHDGGTADPEKITPEAYAAIHPCYWRALGVTPEGIEIDLLTHIHDDYSTPKDRAMQDRRMQRLGQVVEELPQLAPGQEHASDFEDWVERAIKIIFSGDLGNIELHPAPDGTQRRDLVATVFAQEGFWRRVYEDYGSRQVVFEVKNYGDLGPDDYRQALAYSGREYGKLVFVVYRSETDHVNQNERSHLQEMYKQHDLVIVLLSAKMLSRFVSKTRRGPRRDYWNSKMGRLLDTHLRSYLSISAGARGSSRRKRRVSRP